MVLDCRSVEPQYLAIPQGISVVIVHSGVAHQHSRGELSKRRASCEAAVAAIQKMFPQVRTLRDVAPEELENSHDLFDNPVDFARATHVVHENRRVFEFVRALQAGDFAEAGLLMYATHASLRDRYDASIPEIDTIVDIAQRTDGVWGARLTGGGFGGCVCILADSDKALAVKDSVMKEYTAFLEGRAVTEEKNGVIRCTPYAFITNISNGAGEYKSKARVQPSTNSGSS